ncbi:MAG: TetM/TetW/TetO/TetS family tetracycline resistance ribosomal protection protein, partial [Oscillospiraceae bacterium]|nr:TetM/TetW/TetO/TetS family tetracycline resistance ribosomal protection protein [Oscillospiraceae bacterium]
MTALTIGIFAQVDAGKTTLSEALLYYSGSLKKPGRVDHGNAFLDHHSIERARGITVFSKEARFQVGDRCFTLLDTPGHVDFSGEAERVMQVLDYAVLLISGTDGVQAHTVTLWRLLRRYHIPTFLFFNKMDLPGANKVALLAQVKKELDSNCILPDDADSMALCDEGLLEEYLDRGTISPLSIAKAVEEEWLFPCYFGSALHLEGIQEFLEALGCLTRPKLYPDSFCARVYKISRDHLGNRLTWLKVTGGCLKVRSPITYKETEEKVTQLRLYSGTQYQAVDEVQAGQVCAVLGLSKTLPGDGLGDSTQALSPVLTPVMTYRIGLPLGTDERVALQKLKQLEEEEPLLRIVWDEQLRQIRAQLMGQVQIEVLQTLIAQRFDLQVTIDSGKVSYRETISNTVEGVGHFEPLRHYAEVHLILEPLPRGSGVVLDTSCPEDSLDRNWQRLILTHLAEKTHKGVLTGAPITDIKLTLAAGRAHLKHTEGGDFRQATYRAVRQGLMQAQSVLLEPIYRFKLSVPAAQIGRAINDIRAMGGEFDSPEEDGEHMILCGTAPVSEMQSYGAEVVSYTRGKGKLLCTAAGYAPCHNAAAVMEAAAYDPEADVINTPDSIFCSHGAGINIKWDKVPDHMHLESVLKPRSA